MKEHSSKWDRVEVGPENKELGHVWQTTQKEEEKQTNTGCTQPNKEKHLNKNRFALDWACLQKGTTSQRSYLGRVLTSRSNMSGFPLNKYQTNHGVNGQETPTTRSSSREVRLRLRTFLVFVYFSRGTESSNLLKGIKGSTGGGEQMPGTFQTGCLLEWQRTIHQQRQPVP